MSIISFIYNVFNIITLYINKYTYNIIHICNKENILNK